MNCMARPDELQVNPHAGHMMIFIVRRNELIGSMHLASREQNINLDLCNIAYSDAICKGEVCTIVHYCLQLAVYIDFIDNITTW